MTEKVTPSEITPALSKDVQFTQKVQDVDDALKSRSAAQKNIKTKWAGVVKVLVELGEDVPARRVDAAVAANYVARLSVLEPKDKKLEDTEKLSAAQSASYQLADLVKRRSFMREAEKQFPGFQKFSTELLDLADLANEPRKEDKKATATAKAKLQKAVDAYVEAIEAYDETVESVANVKEYIAVVKDVAEISAIAQGAQRAINQ